MALLVGCGGDLPGGTDGSSSTSSTSSDTTTTGTPTTGTPTTDTPTTSTSNDTTTTTEPTTGEPVTSTTTTTEPDTTTTTTTTGEPDTTTTTTGETETTTTTTTGEPDTTSTSTTTTTTGDETTSSTGEPPAACGDGNLDDDESCDGADLGGQSCLSQGFDGGELGCLDNCTFDLEGCTACGDGQTDPGEGCDDGNTMAGDGCDADCQVEACDPDGVYTIEGAPIAYACCQNLVSVNITGFTLSNDGATIASSPSNPVAMTGAATTCPNGEFANQGVLQGGCTETYAVEGDFVDADTWSGTYTLTFTGNQCSCFDGQLGTPCVNQVFPITATR